MSSPKKSSLKQRIPTKDAMLEHPSMRIFGQWLHKADVWHFNRHYACRALFIGVFFAFIPLPTQMSMAAITCIVLGRANLPLAVSCVWLSNPLTIPPIFYGCYKVGSWLLQVPVRDLNFQLNWQWLSQELGQIWQPFLLGSLVCGLFFGFLAYTIAQFLWRRHSVRKWRARKTHHHMR